MKKLLLTAALALTGAAFAQDDDLPPADASSGAPSGSAKPGTSPAGKVAPGTPTNGKGAPGTASKPAEEEAPGPDVSKMPFTPESIKTVVAHHQPKIQGCYNETLAGRKSVVEGKLMTSFVITAEGLVKKPKVERKGTSVKDGRLNECVVAVLAAMQFPKPPDSREHPVAYPFNLKAEK